MRRFYLTVVLGLATLWASAALAQQQCGCCFRARVIHASPPVRVLHAPQRSYAPAPRYHSQRASHHRVRYNQGEYWERRYGPFGPRGFDW